jgi:hypothetical protein
MKLKQSVLYRLKDLKNSIFAFYLTIIAIILLVIILKSINSLNVTTFGGTELGSMILLFVLSLCSFKSAFYMFVQNGVSRKTMFYSYLISAMVVSGTMALIDSVCYTLLGTRGYANSTFEQIYFEVNYDTIMLKILVSFIWTVSAYMAVSVIGFFITVLYYRMNKIFKLIVSISIPCLLLIILPAVDIYYEGRITSTLRKCFQFLLGTGENINPLNSVITCGCVSIVFAMISYGMVKKVAIKRA